MTVSNHQGGSWFISKNLLTKHMWSADHFDKEVKCSMTELAEIIENCQDTIFQVQFRKKIDVKSVEQKLKTLSLKDLKDAKEIKKLSKTLIDGEVCNIVGHLVESENNMGRSLIIDLNAPKSNNFRQVDHRSIESIIFRNVKYSIGKRSGDAPEQLPLKIENHQPLWTESKLAIGNWFSSVCYYKIKEIVDGETVIVSNVKSPKQDMRMSRDILQKEMYSSQLFEKTEKVSRSNIVELMMNAKETVMTVEFRKKVSD